METLELINLIENLFIKYGYLIIFASSFVETSPLGFTIPGGIILFAAGFFSYGTKGLLAIAIIFGWLGTWSTLLISYYLGSTTGMKLVEKFKQTELIQKAKKILDKRGGIILTTALASNITRFWVAYIAGIEKYHFSKFMLYSGIASLIWNIIIPTLGYFAGMERDNLEILLQSIGFLGWVFIIALVGIILLIIKSDVFEEGK